MCFGAYRKVINNILKVPLGISIEIIEIMKKKYLLKQPSYQAMPKQ